MGIHAMSLACVPGRGTFDRGHGPPGISSIRRERVEFGRKRSDAVFHLTG